MSKLSSLHYRIDKQNILEKKVLHLKVFFLMSKGIQVLFLECFLQCADCVLNDLYLNRRGKWQKIF